MWPSADALALTAPQRNALRRLVRGRNTTQKMVLRAHIVLRCAQGLANHAMARELGVNRKTVILWRKRFAQSGLDGLRDRTRPGRKPALSAEFVQCILDTTLHEKPRAATHWSTRTLAKHLGVSKMAIQRVWKAHGLQPHRLETFKLSRDKQFVEKLRDVVGLYLNPPEHALVLSVDEKSQIQALDRSQPGLPLKKGRAGTMTHDFFLAQSRRALVPRADTEVHPPRRVPQCSRTRGRHPRVPGSEQPSAQALCLDSSGTRYPRQSRARRQNPRHCPEPLVALH